MNAEQTPENEEIKETIDIPVEEDIDDLKDEEKKKQDNAAENFDVVDELKNLGRQFAEALDAAWNSEERQRIESEVREGVHSFVDEVDKVFREAKESDAAAKVKTEAAGAKEKVGSSDIGQKAVGGFVMGLRWLSDELGHLADQFNAAEKAPEDVEPVVDDAPVDEVPVEETAAAAAEEESAEDTV